MYESVVVTAALAGVLGAAGRASVGFWGALGG